MSVVKRSGALTPAEQLKVLALVWDKGPEMDGWVFLPWIPGWTNSKEQRRKNWNEGRAFKWPQEQDAILAHLENHRTDDLYFTPNTFLGESRVAQHTGEEKVLYADLDEINPRTDIDPDLRPTIAWETSPDRFQAVWLLDDFADGCTEAGGLNHRLTALTGADPSGWDTTQLLRVPGRRNFKFGYKDDEGESPPGRLLWVNSKRYDVDWLGQRLPEVQIYGTGADVEDGEIDALNAKEIWNRVRLKAPQNVRDYMRMTRYDIGEEHDRSEVLWQIERTLADAGCSVAEIVAVVRSTPWNKHHGRNNEMAQLKSEAAKALGVTQQRAEEQPLEDEAEGVVPELFSLPNISQFGRSSVARPSWLVRNIWAAGSVGFISGSPKSYKSYLGLDLAISIGTGTDFLNDPQFSTGKPEAVLYIQEEDAESIVKHRAEQIISGKAQDRHWWGQMTLDASFVEGEGIDALGLAWTPPSDDVPVTMMIRKGFTISSPVWQSGLAELIETLHTKMVIIDTLGTTLGDVELNDSVKMNERVLKPMKIIAEATGCAIAIVHHNKKGDSTSSRLGQQMLGSVAMHAWVESAIYVQSKEKDINQPHSEIKVSRENKLAEDLNFRVRIPTMWEEKGNGTEGVRQVWEPEVFIGWGDSNAVAEAEKEVASRKTGRHLPGQTIAGNVMDMGEGWHDFRAICEYVERSPAPTRKQLENAVRSSLLQKDEENDRYRVVG
jgi:hypothetical protein